MAPGLTLIRFSKYLKVFLLVIPDVNGVILEKIMFLNMASLYSDSISPRWHLGYQGC